MSAVDIKELGPENSDERARRLRRLKECVASRQYDVSCADIAQGMIIEVISEMTRGHDPEEPRFLQQS